MGLTVVLAALHLLPPSIRQREQDPEKAASAEEEPPDDGHAIGDDDEDDEDEEGPEVDVDEVSEVNSTQHLRRQAPYNRGTFLTRRIPRTLTWDTSAPSVPWLSRIRSLIFPPDENEAALEKFIPNYRWTPIISGVIIPFSILLEIPGLTEHWYIRTEGNQIVDKKPNSVILDVALAFSMMCALCANICLVIRFLEKYVWTATLLTIAFLSVHDIINIICVTTFGVQHRFDDGFTYGQSFWLTICSTAVSTVTNITLILDFVRTPSFAQSGSGLTRKQRSLMIIVIVLLVYIALGALINSFLQDLNFIDGLFFTVVTIETIGFGDIVPTTTGSRVFTCCYMVVGIINLGVAIGMTRETVLEGLDIGYRKRMRNMRSRRREARRYRRWEARWKRAVEWRLKKLGQPAWIPDDMLPHEQVRFVGLPGQRDGAGEVHWMKRWLESIGLKKTSSEHKRHVFSHGKHLNIDALSPQQLEAAALEAGVPLEMFLHAPNHTPRKLFRENSAGSHPSLGARIPVANVWPADSQTPTHAQVGRMAAMLTKFAMATTGTHIHALGQDVDRRSNPNRERQESVEKELGTPRHDPVWGGCDCDAPSASRDSNANTDGSTQPTPPVQSNVDANVEGDSHNLPAKQTTIMSSLPKSRWMGDLVQGRHHRAVIMSENFRQEVEKEEKRAHFVKMTIAWSLFIMFWLIGSAIFSKTEGWSFGIALYFCVVAFTTTGYGDYAPASPAGRSIFVVWALLGVGTVTILISVIEEAGSSRYKRALHSKSFDIAVKKYRERERQLDNRMAECQRPRVSKEDNVSSMEAAIEAAHSNAQRELEHLPQQIIHQTRSFHDHIRFFVDSGGQSLSLIEATEGRSEIPDELRELLDEISHFGEISGRMKREIMEDTDSRNTLLMLSVERTLRSLISCAERALAALAERDHLVQVNHQAVQEQPRATSPSSETRMQDSEAQDTLEGNSEIRQDKEDGQEEGNGEGTNEGQAQNMILRTTFLIDD